MNRSLISWMLLLIINMNVMIGAGIFVYPSIIASYAQSLGFLSFGLVFCIMLPLVLTIAQLAALYPAREGGLYVYSATALGRMAGIITASVYFIAKALSCSIMIRIFVVYLYVIIPALSSMIPVGLMRLMVIIFLFVLNLFGIYFGAYLQAVLIFFKILPIAAVIITGFFKFNFAHLTLFPASFGIFASSLPFAFYPMMGFETCCAIGHIIGDRQRIASTVLVSFFTVTCIYMLFQFFLFGVLGSDLIGSGAPLVSFFNAVFQSLARQEWLLLIGIGAVMISAISAAYGILYANSWYVVVIGREFQGPIGKFNFINRFGIPVWAVLLHALLIVLLLLLTDNIALLGRLSVFGVLLSYLITVVALLRLYKKRDAKLILPFWVALLSFASCAIMGFICIKDLF
ncbi:APC family permease [Candidatus Dependentiae bacterium]|nr:MAG: APC family permease [Candidatus Dependentiae bacterium]